MHVHQYKNSPIALFTHLTSFYVHIYRRFQKENHEVDLVIGNDKDQPVYSSVKKYHMFINSAPKPTL